MRQYCIWFAIFKGFHKTFFQNWYKSILISSILVSRRLFDDIIYRLMWNIYYHIWSTLCVNTSADVFKLQNSPFYIQMFNSASVWVVDGSLHLLWPTSMKPRLQHFHFCRFRSSVKWASVFQSLGIIVKSR
jgi:hypothetical protein